MLHCIEQHQLFGTVAATAVFWASFTDRFVVSARLGRRIRIGRAGFVTTTAERKSAQEKGQKQIGKSFHNGSLAD